jgi:glycosyltransferase involved in cell wall biosynthesis
MRIALFLDNRCFFALGALPRPSLGNPGIGGTEYEAFALAEVLLAAGVDLQLLLTVPQSISGIDGDAITVVPSLGEGLRAAVQAGADLLIFRPGFASEAEWSALEKSPIPLVAWFHNLGCHDQRRYEALKTLRRWVLVSGPQLDYFRHSRLAHQAVVIPNLVAVPPASRGPRSLEHALAATDLAYVGAITPFKGFDRLASQWEWIAERCPQARLRVFGGANLYGGGDAAQANAGRPPQELTPYEQHCRQILRRGRHSDRVLFEGSQGLERYDTLPQVAVGVVNPSGVDETFCLSAAEFNACGIPVVTARRHALISTVPEGLAGLLAGNDQELARCCVELLQDPERAWRLGCQGQAHVESSYGPEAVLAGWQQLFRDMTQARPTQTPAPQSPWWHENRWLRQLWGVGLVLPFWPSWPVFKQAVKALLQGGSGAIKPRAVGLLTGLIALLVWALVVFGKYGGNPTGLARIGDQLPLSPRLQGADLVVIAGKRGNDGQQFLSLALDPLQQLPGTSAALDNPIYRGKRLLYPLLAWLAGLGQPALIPWSLGLINVALIGCCGALVAGWAQLEQRSPQWGLAVLALPSYWITLSLDTADLLATTLLLASALAFRSQRPAALVASLSVALLSRETGLLAWASSGLTSLRERRWRWLLPLALVPLPLLAWTASLKARFPATADGLLVSLHFTWPGVGIATKALQLLGLASFPGAPLGTAERLFDSLCFGLWLLSLGLLLAVALRPGLNRWLRLTAALYLVPALCTSTQILARFPDYTRVWIDVASLALLALLSLRSRLVLRSWAAASLLTSIGYGVGYWFAP